MCTVVIPAMAMVQGEHGFWGSFPVGSGPPQTCLPSWQTTSPGPEQIPVRGLGSQIQGSLQQRAGEGLRCCSRFCLPPSFPGGSRARGVKYQGLFLIPSQLEQWCGQESLSPTCQASSARNLWGCRGGDGVEISEPEGGDGPEESAPSSPILSHCTHRKPAALLQTRWAPRARSCTHARKFLP